ncbi:TetR/AcrR family transcriptional regulator [Sinanaerobacter chloroacetimidivorans]|uniref:TetR/AcrR family transcriptional regulator n=1 Tax=Sinanaerobacter chloroacetimidivorans TaxID=2818044 RepID=A0A8J8AZX4_9FIRM|nr:TetR/AcrR family transcriptional regulator [Sinanaerobacter chloroacetimidivorans]MBR0596993.1 TetR/AcrR family transcriptional regulator [Sinanaerobacter chloroacetimidivorans]
MSQKRQEIIKIAAALIESKGYENTKLSDILEAAAIGKGQFYHYFSSKHELGLEVLDYFYEIFDREVLEGILSSKKSPEAKINEMLQWVLENHTSKQARCGCIFGNIALELSEHDPAFSKKVREVFDKWIDKLSIVLEEMARGKEGSSCVEVAQGVVALIEGGIMIMKNKQDIKVLEDILTLARRMIATS